MLAAMALSPLAALSLPLLTDPAWQEGAAAFRLQLKELLGSPAAERGLRDVDEGITYMDWTYPLTGIDLSQVWDPELWIRFKEAVAAREPSIFWNKLLDRVQYHTTLPGAGLVGDMRISYAKLLQLLQDKRVKRLVVYAT